MVQATGETCQDILAGLCDGRLRLLKAILFDVSRAQVMSGGEQTSSRTALLRLSCPYPPLHQ